VFKMRVAYLQAINRVAVMFGENKRIEAALWFLMDRVHATTLEMWVLSESLSKANILVGRFPAGSCTCACAGACTCAGSCAGSWAGPGAAPDPPERAPNILSQLSKRNGDDKTGDS